MERTDEELVRECLEGAHEAYGVLVKRYQHRVIHMAHRALRDEALAEDLAQEVFIRALRSLKGFKPGRRFRPWLMTIAANRIRDHFKARARRGEVVWEIDRTVSIQQSSPLDRTMARQSLAKIESGIALMPDEVRQVLRLRFGLGLDYDEISQALDLPLGTVKSRISRARAALRELMNEVLK